MNPTCRVTHSKHYTNKRIIVKIVEQYENVCILYNAKKKAFLNDPRHKHYDINVIRVLYIWATKYIPSDLPRIMPIHLQTIPEEDEEGQSL